MKVVEEVNMTTGRKRYRIVSEPKPIDFNIKGAELPAIGTELGSSLRSTWRTRRGAESALRRWNKRNSWKRKHETPI